MPTPPGDEEIDTAHDQHQGGEDDVLPEGMQGLVRPDPEAEQAENDAVDARADEDSPITPRLRSQEPGSQKPEDSHERDAKAGSR